MKEISKKIILEAQNILRNYCVSYDDLLKRDGQTCYTIPKESWDKVREEFSLLGYVPEIESESENFVTYKLSDYF